VLCENNMPLTSDHLALFAEGTWPIKAIGTPCNTKVAESNRVLGPGFIVDSQSSAKKRDLGV
jgi:hypothetical protein